MDVVVNESNTSPMPFGDITFRNMWLEFYNDLITTTQRECDALSNVNRNVEYNNYICLRTKIYLEYVKSSIERQMAILNERVPSLKNELNSDVNATSDVSQISQVGVNKVSFNNDVQPGVAEEKCPELMVTGII